MGYAEPLRVLCTRELQVTIKESFHAELKSAIAAYPWLSAHYDVGIDYLRGKNGTEFIFRGLRHNMSGIKSMAQVDLCIIEEAEDIPERSWQDLEPTIRKAKSEIWVIWNPRMESSPVDKRFIQSTPPRTAIVKLNYNDNPFLSKELEEQRHHAQTVLDAATYAHIWEGCYWLSSDAQVFNGKFEVKDFKPPTHVERFFYGADWGFSKDPTAVVRSYVQDGCLYIDSEAVGVNVEIDDLPQLFRRVTGADKWLVKADNSRPETIAAMQRRGFNVQPARKWSGSVEDGIAYLRNFKRIIIHPTCKHTLEEFRLYSYKIDRLTGDVLPVIVDAHNHCIDALRYSMDGYIRPPNELVGFTARGL